jgi:hypothetical protein
MKTLERRTQLTKEDKAKGKKGKMFYQVVEASVLEPVFGGHVPKLPYRLITADVPYTTRTETGFTKKELSTMIENVLQVSTSEYMTFIVFAGSDQILEVKEAMVNLLDGCEKVYWFKPNARTSGVNRHVNQIEEAMVGYKCTAAGVEGMRPAECFFKWLPEKECDWVMNTNVYEYDRIVHNRHFMFAGGKDTSEKLNEYQKPLHLAKRLLCTYGVHGEWLLDLCSGSGTFAVAALQQSWNVISVDNSPRMCLGIQQRLLGALEENPDKEITTPEEEKAEKAAKKRAA